MTSGQKSSFIARFSAAAGALAVMFFSYSVYIYITADVESLRGVAVYTPPFKKTQRQAGLALVSNLTLSQMPDSLVLATLYGEDPGFPLHAGIKPQDMLARMHEYFTGNASERAGCCSTLTQQLAKNIFTGSRRSLYRKYIEALYALKIERHFSKEDIFTLYINMAETGPDAYGYSAAAKIYFHKQAKDLTPEESVFIVSVLPSPERYSRWLRNNMNDPDALRRMASEMRGMVLLREELARAELLPSKTGSAFFSRYRDAVLQGRLSATTRIEDMALPVTLRLGPAPCRLDEIYNALIDWSDLQVMRFIEKQAPAVLNVKNILAEKAAEDRLKDKKGPRCRIEAAAP